MKYIILVTTLLLSSCGVKDKILKWNNSGELGVPKQNIERTDLVSNDPQKETSNIPTATVIETTYTEEATDVVDENNNYLYFIPFVILGILAFLVFRLKKQSMNSL